MLCSISATGKSGSKWLDRLRSSKGIPSGTDLDLEQFLNQNQNSSSSNAEEAGLTPTSDPKRSPNDPALHRNQTFGSPNPDGDTRLLSIMSNVLAELFVMGDSNNLPKVHGKKCSRKQPNPKFFAPLDSSKSCTNNKSSSASTENALRKSGSASPMTDDNSGVGIVKDRSSDEQLKLVEDVNCGDEEEKEKGCVNLSGFSRTEVTVIDTSFSTWKFEKVLFRKKNVWKVRDKKGKMVNLGKKRRKASDMENENNGGAGEKKQKVLHGQCSLSKMGCGEAFNEEGHWPNKSEAACKKILSESFGKAPKKNQENSLPRNSEKTNSSVILIKNIPTNKKIGTNLPRSCPKSTQRQSKA